MRPDAANSTSELFGVSPASIVHASTYIPNITCERAHRAAGGVGCRQTNCLHAYQTPRAPGAVNYTQETSGKHQRLGMRASLHFADYDQKLGSMFFFQKLGSRCDGGKPWLFGMKCTGRPGRRAAQHPPHLCWVTLYTDHDPCFCCSNEHSSPIALHWRLLATSAAVVHQASRVQPTQGL